MRDVIAGIVAVSLLVVAASLATTLRQYRRRRREAREAEVVRGRTLIAEIPADDDLVLFSQDATCFYYGDRAIDKRSVVAVRVLINGSPLVAYESRVSRPRASAQPTSFEDRLEGIARDRWDVAIETAGEGDSEAGLILVSCGAIRERVSQELARAVFDAVKRDLESRDR